LISTMLIACWLDVVGARPLLTEATIDQLKPLY
jgi:hypothetical protein